jgi:uncharacterized protein (TIGR03118 family)
MRSSGLPEPPLRDHSLSAAGAQAPIPADKTVLPRDLRFGFLFVLLLFAGLALLGKAAHGQAPAAPTATYYAQQNLVTNFKNKYSTTSVDGRATATNPQVTNAWGLALRPPGAGGHWWIANNGSGTASTYIGDSDTAPLAQDDLKEVAVAPPPGSPDGALAFPTGMVFNGSAEFPCSGVSFTGAPITGGSKFLTVTEDGNIQCWTESGSTLATRMKSFSIVVTGSAGSFYKGAAVTAETAGNRLYVTNFGQRRVEVYDGQYHPILPSSFAHPAEVPADYAPFNVQFFEYQRAGVLQKSLFVTYAQTTDDPNEEADGPGLGAVAEFDTDGVLVRTLQSSYRLSAPWGLAIAPADFGRQSGSLLVGNFGDGTIVAFDLSTGNQQGYLRGIEGQAVQIGGLWGLAFGNGTGLGRSNYLYFTAGPSGEADGLFGSLHWVGPAAP